MSISQNFPEEGPTLNLNFAGSRTLDPRITFSRTTTGTYMDANGLIVTAPADAPRFDHRYVNGEIESLGLLVEEQRTNLINYGNDYSASPGGWVFGGSGSRTKDLVGPDGVANNAWTISDTDNAADFTRFYKILGVTPSTTTNYCISSFVKNISVTSPEFYVFFAGSSTKGSYINYNFSTDTITSFASDGGGIQPTIYGRILYPNGWVRIYFVVNDANNGSNTTLQYRIYPNGRGANTTGAMGLFGSQIEIGTFPTSYIPTEGSEKTRNPDNASITGSNFSSWYNPSEGTLSVRWKTYTPDYSIYDNVRSSIVLLNGGGALRGYYLDYLKSDGRLLFGSRNDTSAETADIGPQTKGNQTISTLSYSISLDSISGLSKDNTTIVNSTLYEFDNNTLVIGNYVISGTASQSQYLNGTISQLTYYPTRLPNAQLQTLTR